MTTVAQNKSEDFLSTSPECEYCTTQKSNRVVHHKSVHMGQQFQCPDCEYPTTWEIINHKFPCPECDYQATQKSHLVTHQKSVHMGKHSNVQSVNIRRLRKGALKIITTLFIWAENSISRL
jgi:hypothetical protein